MDYHKPARWTMPHVSRAYPLCLVHSSTAPSAAPSPWQHEVCACASPRWRWSWTRCSCPAHAGPASPPPSEARSAWLWPMGCSTSVRAHAHDAHAMPCGVHAMPMRCPCAAHAGVIGAGRIGLVHLEALSSCETANPVIISNPTIAKAKAAAEKYKLPKFSSGGQHVEPPADAPESPRALTPSPSRRCHGRDQRP